MPHANAGREQGSSGDILPRDRACPLACLSHHKRGELTDRNGRVRGTVCGLCERFVSRETWAVAFAEGRP